MHTYVDSMVLSCRKCKHRIGCFVIGLLSAISMDKADEEVDGEIEQQKTEMESWKKDKRDFARIHKAGKPLEEIYDY